MKHERHQQRQPITTDTQRSPDDRQDELDLLSPPPRMTVSTHPYQVRLADGIYLCRLVDEDGTPAFDLRINALVVRTFSDDEWADLVREFGMLAANDD